MMLDQHSKSTSHMFTEKKINELMENEKRLQADVEKVKQDREQRI
jgi:hypothetical protein